ncbi:hypothetical protein SO802_009977 [Lithocarpus litseifolius]|uniref:Retrovirus-related Pol polyprotein from transposon TNT 1-94-like beta-barrel domain-containing protein n=1 Tax=Lithocarpus litseifolius TaxID=425828 RepID=A0AAW2DCZ3_9ROSI
MKNKNKSSSCCNNCHRQSSKRFYNFYKRFGHNIETCYHRNKLAISIFATIVSNTESVQPMAPISAQSKSSGHIFTISIDDLENIIANVIRMVGNASYSSSLLVLSGLSPSSWLMDSACCNHMIPHSSLFFEFKPTPHPLNIRTANVSTMSSHNISSVSTSNLSVLGVFNVLDLSYNLFSVGQLAELGYRIIFDYSGCIV